MKSYCDLCRGIGIRWRPHVTWGTIARWFARLALGRPLPWLTQQCPHCDGRGVEPPPCGPAALPPAPPPRRSR